MQLSAPPVRPASPVNTVHGRQPHFALVGWAHMSDEQQPRTRRSCAKSAGRIPPSTIVGGGGDGDGVEGGGWGGGRCNSSDRLSTIDGNNNGEMYQNPRSGRGLSSPAPSGTSSTNVSYTYSGGCNCITCCIWFVSDHRYCHFTYQGRSVHAFCLRRGKTLRAFFMSLVSSLFFSADQKK